MNVFPKLNELELELPETTYNMIDLSLYKNTLLKLFIEFSLGEGNLEGSCRFKLKGEFPYLKELGIAGDEDINIKVEDTNKKFPNLAIFRISDFCKLFSLKRKPINSNLISYPWTVGVI